VLRHTDGRTTTCGPYPEAGPFADDLIATLTAAGWKVEVGRSGLMSPPPYGLTVYTGQRGPIMTPPIAALVDALKRAGVDSSVQFAPVPGGGPGIRVGLKPLAP